MIAQEIALEYPERVASLNARGATGGLPRLDLLPRSGLLCIFEAALRSLRPTSDPEQRIRDLISRVAAEDFSAQGRPGDEAWATVAAMLEEPTSGRGFGMQLLASARHSSWSRLSMPVHVHHGTEDPLIPFAAGRELARRIPNAEFVAYEGTGHAIFLERPEGGARLLAFSPSATRARHKGSPALPVPGDVPPRVGSAAGVALIGTIAPRTTPSRSRSGISGRR